MFHKKVSITCPECGFVNQRPAEMISFSQAGYQFMFCDLEEGGCDRQFGFKVKVTFEVDTARIAQAGDLDPIERHELEAFRSSGLYKAARDYADQHDVGFDEAIEDLEFDKAYGEWLDKDKPAVQFWPKSLVEAQRLKKHYEELEADIRRLMEEEGQELEAQKAAMAEEYAPQEPDANELEMILADLTERLAGMTDLERLCEVAETAREKAPAPEEKPNGWMDPEDFFK